MKCWISELLKEEREKSLSSKLKKMKEIDYNETLEKLDLYLLNSKKYSQEEREKIIETLYKSWSLEGKLEIIKGSQDE